MIKIIEPGKKRIAVCPECKFSYEESDVERGNQRDYYEMIICPCCKEAVDLLHNKG